MGRLGLTRKVPRELRRQFWLQVREGGQVGQAAEALGIGSTTAERWFRQAGGVVPPDIRVPVSGHRLSIEERENILAGISRGDSIRQIAKSLGRAPSTVSRELHKNMRHTYRNREQLSVPYSGRRRTRPLDYRPSLAQQRAEAKASRPKPAKLAEDGWLRDQVQRKLKDKLSPQQIAQELRQEYPEEPEKRVSHETIYQSIYVQGKGALQRELSLCLRTGRALRKPRRKADERRGRIVGAISISDRPAEVEDRAVPGHWEGDLILGKDSKSAIGTLVERTTRFVMLLHLPNGRSAAEVQEAMIAATQKLPQVIWKSLTWDQGKEMANHAQITIATGLEIYFCAPHSPWQRGTNENTNGLLRQYFPKATDLSVHGPEYLDFVSAQMNRRPRKTLGWQRPAQALGRLLSSSSDQPGVAFTP
jgi:IS30 family transposase